MKKVVILVLMMLPVSVACPMFGGDNLFIVAAEGRYQDLWRVFNPTKLMFRDSFKRTPLHLAAMNGHDEMVAELISLGFEVDVCDGDGYTPLHWAAREGHAECARILLEKGANIDSKNRYENTPLHLATLYGHIDCVYLFLERGANYSIKNTTDRTPKNIAKDFKYKDIYDVIVAYEDDDQQRAQYENILPFFC
ncbi:ankyrin repeat domain-containing protein [bacterium]|nr:MAG: ankyrin repeat domain-containing protein [bacterium]